MTLFFLTSIVIIATWKCLLIPNFGSSWVSLHWLYFLLIMSHVFQFFLCIVLRVISQILSTICCRDSGFYYALMKRIYFVLFYQAANLLNSNSTHCPQTLKSLFCYFNLASKIGVCPTHAWFIARRLEFICSTAHSKSQ